MDSVLLSGATVQELHVQLKKFFKENPGITNVQQGQILPIQTVTPNKFNPQLQPAVSFEFFIIIIYQGFENFSQ